MPPGLRPAIAAAVGSWPVGALACTLCDSPQALSVRERMLGAGLWLDLAAVMLPLVLLAGIIATVARGPAGGGRSR